MATLDITRSIDIKAPRTKVWAALTEPDLIAQWFGDTAEFDPTPGAAGVFGWAAWAAIAYLVGGRLFPTPRTKVDWGELLRTTGFATEPGSAGGSGPE